MKLLQVDRVRRLLDQLRSELLNQRTENGHWLGELSSSALSTATAVSALAAARMQNALLQELADDGSSDSFIQQGLKYLAGQQNPDGGFGDTDLSHSNIATSYLVLAASALAEKAIGQSLSSQSQSSQSQSSQSIAKLKEYIDVQGGIETLRQRYGKDKTFVIPILTNLAIAGLVPWDEVQALPFEAAVFPQSMYRFLQIPVVSYAIPALVAIGQAKHFMGRRAFAPLHWIRRACVGRTLRVLENIQPESGGYLEATPLTSFVVMSLAVTHRAEHVVSQKGIQFLKDSMRGDGGWPIDTNLATWVSSLAVHALACDPDDDGRWCSESLVDWHLDCQFKQRHPFTGADPGGWGWTDLSGAVPDGDDTPGAILALKQHSARIGQEHRGRMDDAMQNGERWLIGLQNRDGGWPTFCRGWGKLPFDRSSVDLTAHALRAFGDRLSESRKLKAIRFIERQQRDDGSWLPLWFGNQDLPDEVNPVYGTSRVLMAACVSDDAQARGIDYLIQSQNADGGWGGGSSVSKKIRGWSGSSEVTCSESIVSTMEETALAVEALLTIALNKRDADSLPVKTPSFSQSEPGKQTSVNSSEHLAVPGNDRLSEAILSGVEFLLCGVDDGRHRVAWPIGFYFAKLWYHERLYPLVFTVAALGKYLRVVSGEHDPNWPK